MRAVDELEWSIPVDDPTRPERKPRGCRRHDWFTHAEPTPCYGVDGEVYIEAGITHCRWCFKVKDPAAIRRGKNNRSRGLAIQREVNRRAGLDNIPYNAENHDGRSAMFASEVKSGGSFSERYWKWLKGVPAGADQTSILIVADTPGPGTRRRAIVVLDLDDWADLHGPER